MPHNIKKSPITQAVKLDMIRTFYFRRRLLNALRSKNCDHPSIPDGGASAKSKISDLPPYFTVRIRIVFVPPEPTGTPATITMLSPD